MMPSLSDTYLAQARVLSGKSGGSVADNQHAILAGNGSISDRAKAAGKKPGPHYPLGG